MSCFVACAAKLQTSVAPVLCPNLQPCYLFNIITFHLHVVQLGDSELPVSMKILGYDFLSISPSPTYYNVKWCPTELSPWTCFVQFVSVTLGHVPYFTSVSHHCTLMTPSYMSHLALKIIPLWIPSSPLLLRAWWLPTSCNWIQIRM